LKRRGKHAETSSTKPLARSEDLVVEEVGDDLLVYDLYADKAHSLSAPAARVWQHCDGKTSVEALSAELDMDADAVARALDELNGCELLDTGPSDVGATGTTRREASIKLAKVGGAVAAAPLIVSLALPATAAATVTPEFCTNGGQSHGCGIDCMNRHCCCCCQGVDPAKAPVLCSGDTKCCLPTATCTPSFAGHCSDTADCP
jgi:hypothetical protein